MSSLLRKLRAVVRASAAERDREGGEEERALRDGGLYARDGGHPGDSLSSRTGCQEVCPGPAAFG